MFAIVVRLLKFLMAIFEVMKSNGRMMLPAIQYTFFFPFQAQRRKVRDFQLISVSLTIAAIVGQAVLVCRFNNFFTEYVEVHVLA